MEFSQQIIRKNGTEGRMVEWLMDIGMLANRYVCIQCGRDMKLVENKRKCDGCVWRCYKRVGGHDKDVCRNIRKGSWFENSRLPLEKIMLLTYMWVKNSNHETIMLECDVSTRTATDWKQFCREVCTDMCVREKGIIGGPGVVVEIVESKFGKRKSNKGKHVEGKFVFVGIECGTSKCVMKVVNKRNKNVFAQIIKDHIKPGTTIISDCWKAHDCLQDERFKELIVNHSIEFKNSDSDEHSNSKGTWSAIKKTLPKYSVKDEFEYLCEYVWRRQHKSNDLMADFVDAIKLVYKPAEADPPS